MKKTTISINIDTALKQQAEDLFSSHGLDMSTAVNLFLHHCVLNGNLPFPAESPAFSDKTLEAMEEAKRIARDSDIPGFTDMASLKNALLN